MITLLDGPMGSLLNARGVATPAPLWSAAALVAAPAEVAQIHADYAAAGATVHTANTFRTKERNVGRLRPPPWAPYQAGAAWETLTRRAVEIARAAVPSGHRVAGSLAPLEDCYRPDLSPPAPRPEHRAMARALASAGVDLLLCETFPHVGEALIAVEEAVLTGLPVWVAFTAGPEAELLTPAEMERGAREAIHRGATAILVNCTAAHLTLPYVEALARACAADAIPFGAYANAGDAPEHFNRAVSDPEAVERYVEHAATWIEAGATLVGSCCGTGPAHITALAAALHGHEAR